MIRVCFVYYLLTAAHVCDHDSAACELFARCSETKYLLRETEVVDKRFRGHYRSCYFVCKRPRLFLYVSSGLIAIESMEKVEHKRKHLDKRTFLNGCIVARVHCTLDIFSRVSHNDSAQNFNSNSGSNCFFSLKVKQL